MRASLLPKAAPRQDEELLLSTSAMLWVGRDTGSEGRRNLNVGKERAWSRPPRVVGT